MAQGITLEEWLERKRLHDAEVAAGTKKGPFTIPRPKKIIGGPSIGTAHLKAGGKFSSYYKKGGNVITGR